MPLILLDYRSVMSISMAASLGSASRLAFLSHLFATDANVTTSSSSSVSVLQNPNPLSNFNSSSPNFFRRTSPSRKPASFCKVSLSGDSAAQTEDAESLSDDDHEEDLRRARRSADWKAARAYRDSGLIYEGRVEGFNGGGLLIRFYSLVGFLPFPQLSPSHSCKEPGKSIQEIARALTGSVIPIKVIQADEEGRKLIFSEKEAMWTKFSKLIKVGDIYEARVGSVEDYGAFAHLRFPDGSYHLTGLVHVSEVSWDLVQDVRDILDEGDDVKVKIINIDRVKSRITLSIKQLEEDPLLETLDKVIQQDDSVGSTLNGSTVYDIEPLPGLETIVEELRREEGIIDIKITRQGFEKRVVSQDLQLWLSNAPPIDEQFTLLARAGRQVQEIQLTTALDQEGIKRALQKVLERVP